MWIGYQRLATQELPIKVSGVLTGMERGNGFRAAAYIGAIAQDVGKLREDVGAHVNKLFPILTGDGVLRREIQRKEVPKDAIPLDSKVQVRASGKTCVTRQSDGLALSDSLPGVDQDSRNVHVIGFIPARVAEDN